MAGEIGPLVAALKRLDQLGFETRLRSPYLGQWLLRWRKGGARWQAAGHGLDDLGERVLGWLAAREGVRDDERRYAQEGWTE
jgi:hypothetical protein